jgi:hypothetical protein
MRTQPEKANARLAPGAGKITVISNDELDSTAGQHVQDSTDLDNAIEAAENYERALAVKMARLRRLILNLKCKRDVLEELGAALDRRVAA